MKLVIMAALLHRAAIITNFNRPQRCLQ